MLIILEGVDGSGKSTLCKELQSKGAVRMEVKRWGQNPFGKYWEIKNNLKDTLVVFDRSFISDLVYRLEDGGTPDDMNLSQMCVILKGSKIVLCDTDSAFEDSIERGEDNIIDKQRSNRLKELYELVTTMFNKFLQVPVYRYDWKKQNVDDVINFIKGGEKDEKRTKEADMDTRAEAGDSSKASGKPYIGGEARKGICSRFRHDLPMGQRIHIRRRSRT